MSHAGHHGGHPGGHPMPQSGHPCYGPCCSNHKRMSKTEILRRFRLTVRPVRLALIWPQTDLFYQMFDISKKRERFKWMKSMKKEKKEKKKKEPPSKSSGVHEPRKGGGTFQIVPSIQGPCNKAVHL